jgi:hypothetical protein
MQRRALSPRLRRSRRNDAPRFTILQGASRVVPDGL